MSQPSVFPSLSEFVAATAGRNMTRAAYLAVSCGVVMLVLLTVDPVYAAIHQLIGALLWACLVFFVFEWLIRLRHAARTGRRAAYVVSFRGIVDAASALAVPVALAAGVSSRTAWLLGMFWVLK